jgi:hypothetical protein
MLEHIERVWKPFTGEFGEPTLMILDMFSAHIVSSVIRAFNECGTKVEVLPGGCTSSVQAIDNGVNKPVKNYALFSSQDSKH